MLNERIRQLRTLRNLSQVELAKALNVSKQCISNWENDNILPSIEMLVRMAKFFDVSTDYMLCISDRPELFIDGLTPTQTEHVKLLVDDLRKINI